MVGPPPVGGGRFGDVFNEAVEGVPEGPIIEMWVMVPDPKGSLEDEGCLAGEVDVEPLREDPVPADIPDSVLRRGGCPVAAGGVAGEGLRASPASMPLPERRATVGRAGRLNDLVDGLARGQHVCFVCARVRVRVCVCARVFVCTCVRVCLCLCV